MGEGKIRERWVDGGYHVEKPRRPEKRSSGSRGEVKVTRVFVEGGEGGRKPDQAPESVSETEQ